MRAIPFLIASLLAFPGWSRQAWEKPRRDHVILKFDPARAGNEPVAGLTPRWEHEPLPGIEGEVPVFPFLLEGPVIGGFLMGTPGGAYLLDPAKGIHGAWSGFVDASTKFSPTGRYATNRDSHGHSYFKTIKNGGQGQPFYKGGFGNPITRDERFLLSYNRAKHQVEWLPILESDAAWIDDYSQILPAPSARPDSSQDQGFLTKFASLFNPWLRCHSVVSPATAPIPPGLRAQGIEAGENPGSPWLLADVEGRDRLEVLRWNPGTGFWDLIHVTEAKGHWMSIDQLMDGSMAAVFRRESSINSFASTVVWISGDGRRIVPIDYQGEILAVAGGQGVLGILTLNGLEIWDTQKWVRTHRYRFPALHHLVYDAATHCFMAARSQASWLRRDLHLWDLRARKIRELRDPGPANGEWKFAWSSKGRPLAVAQDCPDRVICIDLQTGAQAWQRELGSGAYLDKVHARAKAYLLTFPDGSAEVRDFENGRLRWTIKPLGNGAEPVQPIDTLDEHPWLITRIARNTDLTRNEEAGFIEIWDGLTGRRVARFSTAEAASFIARGPRPETWLTGGFGDGSRRPNLCVVDNHGMVLWSEEETQETWLPGPSEPIGVWPFTVFRTPEGVWVDPRLPRGLGFDPATMTLVPAAIPLLHREKTEGLEFWTIAQSELITSVRSTNYWNPYTLAISDFHGKTMMERIYANTAGFVVSPTRRYALSTKILSYPSFGMNCIYIDPVGPWVPLKSE